MTTLTLRSGKGSALTFAELDTNFSNLNTDLTTTTTALGDYLPLAGGDITGDITTTGEINIADGNWVAWGGGTGRPLIMGNKTDGNMKFYIAGAIRAQLEETSMTFNVADVQINSKLSHNGDANTFLNFGTDTLGITTGGTERIAVSSTGLDVTGALTVTNFDGSADASPVLDLFRNSASPADGDEVGQIKFTGENDLSQSTVYAKITGKISDVTDGTEDGLIEYAVKIDGTNTIVQRLTGTALKLINGTGLEVAGNITVDGTVDGRDVAADGTKLDTIATNANVYVDADVDAYINASILTTDISEGTNEYFTNTRADARIAAASIFDLTDVASGTAVTNLNADKVDGFHGIGIYNAAGTLLNG